MSETHKEFDAFHPHLTDLVSRHSVVTFTYLLYREYEETLDGLQADIVSLEKENQDLKKRLDAYSKKSILTDIARQAQGSPGIAGLVGKEIDEHFYVAALLINSNRNHKSKITNQKSQIKSRSYFEQNVI